jgi:hypothetical protein
MMTSEHNPIMLFPVSEFRFLFQLGRARPYRLSRLLGLLQFPFFPFQQGSQGT